MSGLPLSASLKVDLLFEGVRFSTSLAEAAGHAFPNFYPYRFAPDEPNPTGLPAVPIPYLMRLADGTMTRVKGNGDSRFRLEAASPAQRPDSSEREADPVYRLVHDRGGEWPVQFVGRPRWMEQRCRDGHPMSQAGVSLHGDMMVVNLAPACQFFSAPKAEGRAMRCVFCLYGRHDERTAALGQRIDDPLLPDWALTRMQETINAALAEGGVRHVYLVAGCMLDWEQEAARYLQLARAVRAGCPDVPYLACGSGALPDHALRTLHDEGLVDGVCFNLEAHGEELFRRICPGKAHYYGYARWLRSLERAVELWGAGQVYSAMVAGVELEPQFGGLEVPLAVERALAGAENLLDRGILPIYSLYWPMYGKDYQQTVEALRGYFEQVQLGYLALRRSRAMAFDPRFMCHRCSYMQLECDLDRLVPAGG